MKLTKILCANSIQCLQWTAKGKSLQGFQSGCRKPWKTGCTGPVMRMWPSGVNSMSRVPPGISTFTFSSTRPRRRQAAAAAQLLPEAGV